ncbi:uncharacterized protein LOC127869625 [Dreissena polymorpha]|uniref:uncharacterized protein LOC127869625 n=1 Tax=Dreissena polymorpha TaxID=45954 RepID=UPI002264A151|nr:uncharacterized protein LOC127869625 [Dreissena polymorpha]
MDDALARSLYTIYIDAYDSLVPDNRARTQVQITVLRNQGFPEFDRASYNEQIDEFHQLAVSVVNITARDTRDNDQITYRMIDGSLNQINSSSSTLSQAQFRVKRQMMASQPGPVIYK